MIGKFLPSARVVNGLIALVCLALMMAALYLQEIDELHPCPLCITQRICVIAVGLLALLACLHHPAKTGIRVYAVLQSLAAIGGAIVATRHLWIQSLPADQVPACGPGLQYIFQNFPFVEALSLLFAGDGSCAEVQLFWGLPIPAWVLLACLGLLAANVVQLFRSLWNP
jgi:disulfide bond formation protein DsbB